MCFDSPFSHIQTGCVPTFKSLFKSDPKKASAVDVNVADKVWENKVCTDVDICFNSPGILPYCSPL